MVSDLIEGDPPRKHYYVPKVLILISRFPQLMNMRKLVKNIYSESSQSILTITQMIRIPEPHHIRQEVSFLPGGREQFLFRFPDFFPVSDDYCLLETIKLF